jgi:hypothetical protein
MAGPLPCQPKVFKIGLVFTQSPQIDDHPGMLVTNLNRLGEEEPPPDCQHGCT